MPAYRDDESPALCIVRDGTIFALTDADVKRLRAGLVEQQRPLMDAIDAEGRDSEAGQAARRSCRQIMDLLRFLERGEIVDHDRPIDAWRRVEVARLRAAWRSKALATARRAVRHQRPLEGAAAPRAWDADGTPIAAAPAVTLRIRARGDRLAAVPDPSRPIDAGDESLWPAPAPEEIHA